MIGPIPCFRNGAPPPALESLENRVKRPHRIQCRKWHQNASGNLALLFQNEKKIERTLRSKSGWDALFELAPMAPWRETSKLETKGTTILYLDFKNFYPAILCAGTYPHPARLQLSKTPTGDECGLFRTILHPCDRTTDAIRKHHPFTMTHNQRSLPFEIGNRAIETFLHSPEIPIWAKWFDLEFIGALISDPIPHPLTYRTHQALKNLESQNLTTEEREEYKLQINLASTTPKIASDRRLPSPYGVHCLPAQISGMAKALLCETCHIALDTHDGNRLLAVNTDGFLLETPDPERVIHHLATLGILGNHPGQLRLKAQGDEAIILGSNLWWLLNQNKLVESSGRGDSPEKVPLNYHYGPKFDKKIATIHLADFRHHLDHITSQRTKFQAPDQPEEIHKIIEEEKKRSLSKNMGVLRSLKTRLQ